MNKLNQHYIRLLNYEEARKVIKFVDEKKDDNYANITVGGVSLSVTDECLEEVKTFCFNSFPRFEISSEHPEKTNSRIVEQLKKSGVI